MEIDRQAIYSLVQSLYTLCFEPGADPELSITPELDIQVPIFHPVVCMCTMWLYRRIAVSQITTHNPFMPLTLPNAREVDVRRDIGDCGSN